MTGTPPNSSLHPVNPGMRALRPGVSLVVLLAGSLLVGFSMGRWLAPLAAWIGPVLILRLTPRDHKVGRGYAMVLAALVAGVRPRVLGCFWTASVGLYRCRVRAVVEFGLSCRPHSGLAARGGLRTLVFPLALTTLEFLNNHTNPLGAWGMTRF